VAHWLVHKKVCARLLLVGKTVRTPWNADVLRARNSTALMAELVGVLRVRLDTRKQDLKQMLAARELLFCAEAENSIVIRRMRDLIMCVNEWIVSLAQALLFQGLTEKAYRVYVEALRELQAARERGVAQQHVPQLVRVHDEEWQDHGVLREHVPGVFGAAERAARDVSVEPEMRNSGSAAHVARDALVSHVGFGVVAERVLAEGVPRGQCVETQDVLAANLEEQAPRLLRVRPHDHEAVLEVDHAHAVGHRRVDVHARADAGLRKHHRVQDRRVTTSPSMTVSTSSATPSARARHACPASSSTPARAWRGLCALPAALPGVALLRLRGGAQHVGTRLAARGGLPVPAGVRVRGTPRTLTLVY